jgi:hypothetical protein
MIDPDFLATACRLAQAADAAYLDHSRSIAARLGTAQALVCSSQATLGYVAEVNGDLVVAFRGTVPGELLNWLTNLDFTQIPVPPGSIHRGMTQALDLVWEPVRQHARTLLRPGQTVWFTGHSLGGSLAQLAAARFTRDWGDVRVCTFGAPRVGCPEFAASYRPKLYRFERPADLVCHLPPPPELLTPLLLALNAALPAPVAWLLPAGVQYCHVGKRVLLQADGSLLIEGESAEVLAGLHQRLLPLLSCALKPATLLEEHQMEGYLACLEAASSKTRGGPRTAFGKDLAPTGVRAPGLRTLPSASTSRSSTRPAASSSAMGAPPTGASTRSPRQE